MRTERTSHRRGRGREWIRNTETHDVRDNGSEQDEQEH
jgi:hypothetical protein